MIDRSMTREIPHFPVALYEVAHLFGTLVEETILAKSVTGPSTYGECRL